MSRLTTDVQEFKSSFKLVISQVSGSGPVQIQQARLACPSLDVLALPCPALNVDQDLLLPEEGVREGTKNLKGGIGKVSRSG